MVMVHPPNPTLEMEHEVQYLRPPASFGPDQPIIWG